MARIALPRSSGAGFAGWLRSVYADAERVPWLPLIDKLSLELAEYFASKRREFSVAVEPRGTDFQLAVWREIAAIPYGDTLTYAEVARAAGRPNARARGGHGDRRESGPDPDSLPPRDRRARQARRVLGRARRQTPPPCAGEGRHGGAHLSGTRPGEARPPALRSPSARCAPRAAACRPRSVRAPDRCPRIRSAASSMPHE